MRFLASALIVLGCASTLTAAEQPRKDAPQFRAKIRITEIRSDGTRRLHLHPELQFDEDVPATILSGTVLETRPMHPGVAANLEVTLRVTRLPTGKRGITAHAYMEREIDRHGVEFSTRGRLARLVRELHSDQTYNLSLDSVLDGGSRFDIEILVNESNKKPGNAKVPPVQALPPPKD